MVATETDNVLDDVVATDKDTALDDVVATETDDGLDDMVNTDRVNGLGDMVATETMHWKMGWPLESCSLQCGGHRDNALEDGVATGIT